MSLVEITTSDTDPETIRDEVEQALADMNTGLMLNDQPMWVYDVRIQP